MRYQVRHNRTAATAVILYIKWKIDRGSFVRSWWSSFFMYLQYCTVQYSSVVHARVIRCGTCAVNKYTRRTTGTRWDTNHGHYTGNSFTGTSRPRTEVLRTRTYSSAANKLFRSRALRGHLNLYPLNASSGFSLPGFRLPVSRTRLRYAFK